MRRVHARTSIHEVHETIANAVLDAQQGEVEAAQGRATGIDVHANRCVGTKPVFPLRAAGKVVDVFFVLIVRYAHAHQNAARRAAIKASTLCHEHRAGERDGSSLNAKAGDADGFEFLSAQLFKPQGHDNIKMSGIFH